MHVFHIRGLSSVLMLLLAIIGVVLLLLALPAAFMMVLWNAVVFEGFKGPEIDMYQGLLLWGMLLVALKLILKPEIQLEFIKVSAKDKKAGAASSKKKNTDSEASDPNETVALENPEQKE
jgi:hypothetical protein